MKPFSYKIEPGANRSGAKLKDANLSGADLSGANLRTAKLKGAIMPKGWEQMIRE